MLSFDTSGCWREDGSLAWALMCLREVFLFVLLQRRL